MSKVVVFGAGGRAGQAAVGCVLRLPSWIGWSSARPHIRRYLETNGQARPGMNDLLLTTRGRKTGELRRTALVYARDGDRYILAASNAGADRHPAWYLNLVANPSVTVQIGARTRAATARTATAEEKPRLWQLMVATMPSYQGYQEATNRDIPMVIVECV